MGICAKFKTNQELERNGTWVTCTELNGENVINADGTYAKFKIARTGMSNRQYMSKMQPIAKKLDGKDAFALIDAKEQLVNIFVDYCLLDWDNFTDVKEEKTKNGVNYVEEKVPFSKEVAKKYLNEMPELYQWLSEQSSEISNFLMVNREEDLKN